MPCLFFPLLGAEAVNAHVPIGLPGLQQAGGIGGIIRAVRKLLCFQAEGISVLVDFSAFADVGTVKKVSGVELNSRLVGEHFHDPSALFLCDTGCELKPLAG